MDKSNKTKIWNNSTENLISTLYKHKPNTVYYKVFPTVNDQLMIGVFDQGIDVWKIGKVQEEKVFKEKDSNPEMILTDNGNKLVIKFGNKNLYVFDTNSFNVLSKIPLPKNLVDSEFLPNGDINLVLKNDEFNENAFKMQQKIKRSMTNKMKEIENSKVKLSSKTNDVRILDSNLTEINEETDNVYDTMADNEIDSNGNIELSDSERDILAVNKTQPFKYMNLSTKPKNQDNDMKYIDDSNIEKIMSKTQLEPEMDMLDDDLPLTSQPTLFRRGQNGMEVEIIDPRKYRNIIKKLVIEEFDKDFPAKCLYTIYQSFQRVVSIQTSSGDTEKMSKLNFSSRRSVHSIKSFNTSFRDNDDKEIFAKSKQMYETLVVLDDRTVQKIKYWTGATSAPNTEKIVIEEEFNFMDDSNSKVQIQNFLLNESESVMDYNLNFSKDSSRRSMDNTLAGIKHFNLYGVYNDVMTGWSFMCFYAETDGDWKKQVNLVAKYREKKYIKMQIDVSNKSDFNCSDDYTLRLTQAPKTKQGDYSFLLASPSSIIIFKFSIVQNKFSFFKIVEKENISELPVLFSEKRSLFLVTIKNSLQVYDDQLQYFLGSVEVTKNIEEVIINDEKNVVMIYDLYFYYEVDLESLAIKRRIRATNKTKDKFFCPLNFRALPCGRPWKGIFYYVGHKIIQSVSLAESLELKSFPYEILYRCFDKKNHPKAIRQFARYYFASLDQSRRIDYEYGPINPLMMCIFNENSALIQELVNQHYYPSRIHNYNSPLEYGFISKHKASINELCDALLKREEIIYFSRSDFKYLLASDLKICHKVISTIMSDPNIEAMPSLIYMNSSVIAKSSDYLVSMAVLLKREDEQKEIKAETQNGEKKKVKAGANKYYLNSGNKLSKNEISVSTVPFKYNYSVGTDDSVMFIDRFAHSTSEEFVLSDWKEIINIKWRQFKIPYIILFLIFYSFLAFITLSLAFFKTNQLFRWLSVWMNVFFLVYEVFRFFTFLFYKPVLYFIKALTYIDWVSHIGSLIYLIVLYDDYASDVSRIVGVFVLILVYYRGFGFLRIFDTFTSLVGMINTIITELVVFFAILFYAYFTVVILMIKLDNSNSFMLRFQDVYYWVLLGGIEGDAFDIQFSAISIVFGSLFITIVLLNILIAYLSNLFSRLEDQQKMSGLKEKASLILDFEMMVRLFKYTMTGIITLDRKMEELKNKEMVTSKLIDYSKHFTKKELVKLKKYSHNEKHLFIIKQTDGDNIEEEEENIYQKIKNLEKSNEDLTSLILLKNRVLEKNIQELSTILKKSYNDQNKTIDDMREMIGNNFKGIEENTENLIFSLGNNDKKYMKKFENMNLMANLLTHTNKEIKEMALKIEESNNMKKKK